MDICVLIWLMGLILIGIAALTLPMISQLLGSFVITIIGPLIGALVGVYLGFQKNEDHRRKLEEERRLFFRNLLMHEAKKSIKLVEERKTNLIPVDAWNSIVNSGNIALFEGKAKELSNTYFQIQNYNYEAKRVRDAEEARDLHPAATDVSHVSELEKNFNDVITPATLRCLGDLEGWITQLKSEPITVKSIVRGILSVKRTDEATAEGSSSSEGRPGLEER